ncbi:MAG TPA: hypothetical protein GX014_07880 [Firmicutes bacterium]|jgi:uncharacterized protein YaaQ|nr:cyclic-di-AMP receptor [Bacillota bacterium]HHT43300.1 hypothetical protein [Bacillota bacterium]
MKLLITIVQDQDVPALIEALMEHDFRATKLASTGGFLRAGNTTLLIGVEDGRLELVQNLIKKTCKGRQQGDSHVSVGGATVFSVNVERFERI